MTYSISFRFFVCLLAALPCVIAFGCKHQDDHSHGPASSAPADELDPTSKTIFGQKLLLFLEYPHLVRGKPEQFLAHLSVLANGEPIRSGRATLEIGATQFVAESIKRDGLFIPTGALSSAGKFASRLIVDSEQGSEVLNLGEVVVHESEADAKKAAGESGEPVKNEVPFLMEQQWRVKLLLAEAKTERLVQRLLIPARVVTPEGLQAVVAPTVTGRLVLPQSGRFARTGDTVEAGQILGYIEPPLGAAELVQLQALETEFHLKTLDVVRAANEADARVSFAVKERERVLKLREHSLSTQQQVDQAEHNLAVAQNEQVSSKATKEFLDGVLRSRRDNLSEGRPVSLRIPLVAPIRGVIIEASRSAGESVGAQDAVFRIMDTSRVWIEGRVSEFDIAKLPLAPEALASFSALPGKNISLGGAGQEKTIYMNNRVDPESRTIVIRYEVSNPNGELRSGMLAQLAIAISTIESATSIPFESVIMEQGLPTVYVMLEGETFQKREIELGVRDGAMVEVRKGLSAGERVATRGAYVVKLAALSPASFGAGHQH
ncbi:MAG: efflux RND transporter periplasmic adaptor subunit [Planctomycetota bacterium]